MCKRKHCHCHVAALLAMTRNPYVYSYGVKTFLREVEKRAMEIFIDIFPNLG